ncbi:MAG: N-acetyltransferase [Tissierellia bacterium]|nr:N-acetyltransferase [Tissierellia bacterium]
MEKEILLKREDKAVKAYHEGKEVGEVTYSVGGDTLLIIDHTHVDESMKGQRLGNKMVYEVVQMARESGKKIIPLCPFAKKEFEKNESYKDVLKS